MQRPTSTEQIELPDEASLADLQRYLHALETRMGWLDASCERTCFLMGEEVGELFGAVRRLPQRAAPRRPEVDAVSAAQREAVAEEIVDVLNYLLALANRLDIDLDRAFRLKNSRNQRRTWD